MSTTTTNYPTIDDIYADAEKRKTANTNAGNTQITANNEAAQIDKDNFAEQVKTANENLTNRANADKEDKYAYYDEIYDENAVNQYIKEERVAENMANLGLTNSGLNATQLTAIETSRGNADNRARLQEQAAIDDIELQLAADLAENEQAKLNYNASVDAQLKKDNAAVLADVETQNAAVDTQATKDAMDWVDNYNETAQENADARTTQINAATTAVKNLNSDGTNTDGAISQIKYYEDYYGLSETETRTMCSTAGIDYSEYKKNTLSQDVFTNYLTSYNVTEYGKAALIPYLIGEGILLETDEDKIKDFYADWLKNQSGDQNTTLAISAEIDSWLSQGKISTNAATYMKALMKHHGVEYIKSNYSGNEFEQAKAAILATPEQSAPYKTFADSYVEQFYNKDKDHNDTLNMMKGYNIITPTDAKFVNQFYLDHYPPLTTQKYKDAIEKQIIMYYSAGDISENGKAFLYAIYGI